MDKLITAMGIDVPLAILKYKSRPRSHNATRGGTGAPVIICIRSSELRELNNSYLAIRARNPHYLIRGY